MRCSLIVPATYRRINVGEERNGDDGVIRQGSSRDDERAKKKGKRWNFRKKLIAEDGSNTLSETSARCNRSSDSLNGLAEQRRSRDIPFPEEKAIKARVDNS